MRELFVPLCMAVYTYYRYTLSVSVSADAGIMPLGDTSTRLLTLPISILYLLYPWLGSQTVVRATA
jgi:hypothetical protein